MYRNHIDFTKPKREPRKQISDIQMKTSLSKLYEFILSSLWKASSFQYLYRKGCHFAGLCKIVSFLKTNFLGIVHQTFKLSRIWKKGSLCYPLDQAFGFKVNLS